MRFKKGREKTGGRKKGTQNKMSQKLFDEFLATIKEVEQDGKISKGKTLFRQLVEWGFVDKQVGIALLKKLVPDKLYNQMDFEPEENIKVSFEITDKKYNEKTGQYS